MSETIEDAIELVSDLAKCMVESKHRIQSAAATSVIGPLKARIFNDGLDADNRPLSEYSKGHKKRRKRLGRQVSKKDLQLTDRLFNSIQIGNIDGDIVVRVLDGARSDSKKGLTNQELIPILEKKENRVIFSPSDDEIEGAHKAASKEAEKIINKCLKR